MMNGGDLYELAKIHDQETRAGSFAIPNSHGCSLVCPSGTSGRSGNRRPSGVDVLEWQPEANTPVGAARNPIADIDRRCRGGHSCRLPYATGECHNAGICVSLAGAHHCERLGLLGGCACIRRFHVKGHENISFAIEKILVPAPGHAGPSVPVACRRRSAGQGPGRQSP